MSRPRLSSSHALATSRRVLPGLALSLLGAAFVTGCTDSDTPQVLPADDDPLTLVAVAGSEPTALPPKPALAQLATATSATRLRFVDAALGADVSAVFATVIDLSWSPPACPNVDRRGSVIYSSPDCTDDAGVHWSGRLAARSWSDEQPMVIALERWSADAPGRRDDVAFDGTVTVHPDGRFESNLVAYKDGLVTRTYGAWQVENGEVISDLDSYVLVQEHGIAQIGGAWRLPRGGRASGALFLDGADALVLDLDATDGDPACAPISVDGTIIAKRCDLAALADATASFGLF